MFEEREAIISRGALITRKESGKEANKLRLKWTEYLICSTVWATVYITNLYTTLQNDTKHYVKWTL